MMPPVAASEPFLHKRHRGLREVLLKERCFVIKARRLKQ